MGLFSYLFASDNTRNIKRLEKIVQKVESHIPDFENKTDEELKEQTTIFKDRLSKGETLDDLLPEAYAVVREACKRVLNKTPYHVQIMGGIALYQGRIAEMKTGEGKTITEAFPAYLQALNGEGVHIVTVNEYLAKRDTEWIGKIFNFLGLTVGCTLSRMEPAKKKAAYACDITYGTNSEFGFDYLRDNMVRRAIDRVQRGHAFAIVDEVDSVLIDEARTPLILSGMSGKGTDDYKKAAAFVRVLRPNDYIIDEKEKAIRLDESGVAKAEKYYNVKNLMDIENIELNHYINNALRAQFIMKKDNNYIVKDDKILIVDEFTGRVLEGRQYSNGLHQAIEAKERVTIREENRTQATITYQNYFRLYKKLSGMTGTAKTEETEFNKIYNLDVVTIPTNLPVIRKDYNDVVYATAEAKYRNVVKEIKRIHETGRPVLVGTVTIEKSEMLSKALKREKIPHNVLNAKNHELESEIIAQAGRLNQVTIATNMAGRGTDILLGGNPEFMTKARMKELGYNDAQIEFCTSFANHGGNPELVIAKENFDKLLKQYTDICNEEKKKVVELGGLAIIGTERHESRRIDNQLRGRAGRQGDPGSSVFYVSFEDELIRRFGGDKLQSMVRFFKIDDDTPFQVRILTRSIEAAQKRIEGYNFSIRHNVLKFDNVLNEQREIIYGERNKVLDGLNIHNEIIDMINEVTRNIVLAHLDPDKTEDEWDLDELNTALNGKVLPKDYNFVTLDKIEDMEADEVADLVAQEAITLYDQRKDKIVSEFAPEFRIDWDSIERDVLLRTVDKEWMEHIDFMDILRKEIGLRAYGNHDPVVEYKQEGMTAFENMISRIQESVVTFLCNVNVSKPRIVIEPAKVKLQTNAPQEKESATSTKVVDRNAPCPCGSGRKYKNCCGKNKV